MNIVFQNCKKQKNQVFKNHNQNKIVFQNKDFLIIVFQNREFLQILHRFAKRGFSAIFRKNKRDDSASL